MLEAISLCEEISGHKLAWHYEETNRIGDHIWWISDVRKFQSHYPKWKFRFGLREILEQILRGSVSENSMAGRNARPTIVWGDILHRPRRGPSGAIIATGSRCETLTLLPNEEMPRRNASPARTEENARLLLLSGLSDYMISRLR